MYFYFLSRSSRKEANGKILSRAWASDSAAHRMVCILEEQYFEVEHAVFLYSFLAYEIRKTLY